MERDIQKYEERYLDNNDFETYQIRYRRRKVLEILNKYNPQKVLEIGCGMEPLFVHDSGREYITVEPAEKFYHNAVENGEGNTDNKVTIYNAFFEGRKLSLINENTEIELPEDFDMIICSSLLHEVIDASKLLLGIKSICNKQTVVHINIPNKNSIHRLLAYESGIIQNTDDFSDRNRQFQQNRILGLKDLVQLAESNGFRVIDEGSIFIKPFSHSQMQRLLDCKIIDETVLEGFYGLEKYIPGFGSEIFINCVVD